jgi:excisionase family DNA binding protein
MASKKYLGLDEVAARLGLSPDQVNKLREEGRLRGFADRGTWKFKSDDVEEFARTSQADSAPDVPILDLALEDEAFVSPSGIRRGGSAVSDDDGVGEQPTVIRGDMTGSSILDEEPLLNASDSDVRLILDDSLVGGDSTPDVDVQSDSDSDVRLMDPKAAGRAPAKPAGGRSDSDVKLVSDEGDTVSDVRLLSGDDMPAAKSGSDSDVALVTPSKGGTSVFDDEEVLRPLAADSGIALENIADSGISLDAPSTAGRGSGVLLDDSVVVGPSGESSIISLADSGISLDDSKPGSGIQLGGPTDSGIALEALGDGGATMPMMRTTGRRDAGKDTEFEVEAAGDSEFELAMSGEIGTGNDTSVILLEEEDSFVAQPASAKKPAKRQPAVEEFVAAEGDEVVEIEDDFDAFDEEGGSAVAVADEDDDLEFEAADEDFDEGFQTGESQADFAPAAQRVALAAEPEFGTPTVIGLGATSVLLALCGMLMFDLVRSMWGYNDPTLSSWLLDSTKGLF